MCVCALCLSCLCLEIFAATACCDLRQGRACLSVGGPDYTQTYRGKTDAWPTSQCMAWAYNLQHDCWRWFFCGGRWIKQYLGPSLQVKNMFGFLYACILLRFAWSVSSFAWTKRQLISATLKICKMIGWFCVGRLWPDVLWCYVILCIEHVLRQRFFLDLGQWRNWNHPNSNIFSRWDGVLHWTQCS